MKSPREAAAIFDALDEQHPGADTELHFRNAYQLLAATILSAQSTDQRVNMVTPALFERYPSAAALAKATQEELEPQIHSTGFFRAKSKALIGMAQALVENHAGEVPADMEALTALPGVGRKTANVVLGHALGVPGLPVDRHVLRVANRIGLVTGEDAVKVEAQLCSLLPKQRWTRASDCLILHGRRVCKPKPLCHDCLVQEHCDYFRTVVQADERLKAADKPASSQAKSREAASHASKKKSVKPKLRKGVSAAAKAGTRARQTRKPPGRAK